MRLLSYATCAALLLALNLVMPTGGLNAICAARASQPNEGSEGHDHEHKAGNLSPDVKLARDLELMRGHLLIAGELIAGEHWIDAVPHVFHPIEELYDGMKDEMEKRKLSGFLLELKALAQTVKAKQKDAYAGALKNVTAKLDAIEQSLKAGPAPWANTVRAATIATLETAAEEYENAVKDGKITEAVEYQDSRGFVWRAETMLKDEAFTKSDANKAALGEAQSAVGKLKAAWPSAMPPEAAAASAAEVEQRVEAIAKILTSMQ